MNLSDVLCVCGCALLIAGLMFPVEFYLMQEEHKQRWFYLWGFVDKIRYENSVHYFSPVILGFLLVGDVLGIGAACIFDVSLWLRTHCRFQHIESARY